MLRPRALADTGALLAFLDRDDRWHRRCVEAFETLGPPLATTTAVLAEFFHLLDSDPRTLQAAWGFLRSGAVTISSLTDEDLPSIEYLMDKYRDRPMDFADASLVHLAERESLPTVFTIDHNDFETYRFAGKRRFRIVPSR